MSVDTSASARPLAGLGIKPLASLIAHPRLAILGFLLVCLLGVPLVLVKGKPVYQAHALVQVSPRYMKNLREDPELEFQSNTQYRQFVQHQVASIRRHDVLLGALAALEPANPKLDQRDSSLKLDTRITDLSDSPPVTWRDPKESMRRAAERLSDRLMVSTVPDTYLIRIALEGNRSEGLAQVVNAVVASYLGTLQSEGLYGADQRVHQLREREGTLLTATEEKVARRSAIARELGLTAFNAADGNPFDKITQRQREMLADARAKRFEAEAQLNAFAAHGETDLVIRSVQESVAVDPGLNSLKAGLNNRRAALLTTMSGLSRDHPGFQDASEELARIESEIATQTRKLEDGVRKGLEKRFRTGAEQAREFELALAAQLEQQLGDSQRYAALFNEAAAISEDLMQLRKELEDVRERLAFFASEKNSLGFAREVTRAQTPEIPFGTGKKKLALLVLIAAFGAALVCPILRDLLRREIRAPNDVEKIFGFAPMGWVVEQDSADARRFAADQKRRLASAMVRAADRDGLRIAAFAAFRPGAAHSSLVRELAATLDSLGFPAVVVAANSDRSTSPDRHDIGLRQVLEGTASPLAAVRREDGVSTLGIGAGDPGAPLGRLEHLAGSLATLAAEYRFVLVDAPPLMTSSESEFVVRACEATIATIEAEALTRGELGRGVRMLEKLAAPSVGYIVNRVRPLAGGYLDHLMTETLSGVMHRPSSLKSSLRLAVTGLWQEIRTLVRCAPARRSANTNTRKEMV